MAKVVNNSRICKATIFVGLNDKESKFQEISTLEAAKYLQREIVKEFEGGTISEATGIHRHMEKKYIISLWRGCGYLLDTFAVSASCEEEALEILLSKLEKDNRTDLYLTNEDLGDDYDEGTDENYIYIDPTMSDPNAFPAYIRAENLKIVAA